MSHAIAFKAAASVAFVLFFAIFYLTGLLLQSLKKSETSRTGEVILVLFSMGWFGTAMLLADVF